jgi:hypothetical protein
VSTADSAAHKFQGACDGCLGSVRGTERILLAHFPLREYYDPIAPTPVVKSLCSDCGKRLAEVLGKPAPDSHHYCQLCRKVCNDTAENFSILTSAHIWRLHVCLPCADVVLRPFEHRPLRAKAALDAVHVTEVAR